MSIAGRKQVSSRVTVTHERNAPVKPGKLTFNPVHAAFGNGYAEAVANRHQTPQQPVKFVTEPADAKTQGPAKEPVKLIVLPEVTITGKAPGKQDDAKQTPPSQPEKPPPPGPLKSEGAEKAAATVDADGSMVFNADAVKDKIVGTVAKPVPQVADDNPLAKLVPGSEQTSPKAAKAEDVDAKTKLEMTKPADDNAGSAEVDEDQATAAKQAPDEGEVQFGKQPKEGLPAEQDQPGVAAVEPDAGGGGGAADLAAWKSKVSGAIAATPSPTLGDGAGSSITVISATGKGAAARYRGGSDGAAKDVKKAVRPPPVTPKPLPPLPLTVVPAADQAITEASDKKLPDQELPQLKQPPTDKFKNATIPSIDIALTEDLGSAIALPEPPKTDAPGSKEPTDAKARKELKKAKDKEPVPKQGTPGQKMVLKDIAPPITPQPERGTKGASKETFRLVLGEMLRDPGPAGEAKAITDEARDDSYPNKALTRETKYSTLGTDWQAPIQAELESQVKAIADMAGITQAEMAGAVADRQAQLKAMEKGELAKIDKAGADAKQDTKKEGEEAQQAIGAARLAQDEDTLQKLIAANGETDPQVIQLRRDMGVRQLTQRAARQDVNYEKAGERRTSALQAAHTKMENAYKKAGQADEKKVFDDLKKEFKDAEKAGRKPGKLDKKAEKEADEKADKDASALAETGAKLKTMALWEWIRVEVDTLKTRFGELKDAVVKATENYRSGIKSALRQAKSLLDDWASERLEAQESWWESVQREHRQWAKDAQNDAAAWEEARNEQLRDAVAGDLKLIADLEGAMRQRVDMKAFIQERGLDAAQLKVVQKFFKPVGPADDPKKQQFDSIGAVAEGMRARVRANRKPGMIERFKKEILSRPDSEWFELGQVGKAERPPFEVAGLSSKLFHAMDQWGTEEADIFAALSNLTPVQAKALRAHYATFYSSKRGGRSLDADLAYEMGGEELDRAKAQLEGNQALADAAALAEAFWGPGTDEATVMSVLRGKSPEQQDAIRAEYKRQYGRDLDDDLKSELQDAFSSHHDFDRAKALQANDVVKADAIAIDAAMHGGTGLGTEEEEITRIYELNRSEVEALGASKGWTTKQIEEEIKKRNDAIDKAYEAKYPNPEARAKGKSPLIAAMEDEMSDSQLDLGKALHEADLTKIDAAKLGVEKESLWASDETINKVLESQGQRAKRDVERDATIDLNRRAQIDDLRGRPWGRERWTKERSDTKKFIESETKNRAMHNMAALETQYDSKFGPGGMVNLIVYNMMGEDQQKAVDLYQQGGILGPEQEIYYACNGVGTDLDKIKDTLKGKSPAEIAEIRKAWVKRYGGTEADFDARIMEEVSGRDEKDMEWALKGEPQTIDEKIARAKERRGYEHTGYGMFGSQDAEKAAIDAELANLENEAIALKKLEAEAPPISDKDFDALSAPKGEKETEAQYAERMKRLDAQLERESKLDYFQSRFRSREASFDTMIEDHRKAVDSFADTAATIAGIVATVIVMAVVAFFTAGTGAVAIGAALASAKVAAAAAIAAAAATMATKYAIKGGAYSKEEMAVDAVTGAVDAVVSAATAGIGGGLLKVAKAGAPTSKLAAWAAKTRLASGLSKMAKSERMVARVLAGAISEGVEGVAQTFPSALAGNLVDEKNYARGNAFFNIMQGTVIQTGMGGLASAGLPIVLDGALKTVGFAAKGVRSVAGFVTGGFGDNVGAASLARETGDILAKRGDPVDRLAAWKAWKADNPGAPFKQFSEQFDAGILAREADDAARHALQREMRGELLSGIPPAQRKEFAGVPIAVLSDADFAKFTKSASGQAAVIFKDGKPLVLLRETADIKSLREEGIHLLQSKDPKLRKQFKRLDETNLARWNKMGLDEQLSLYRTKIDIELDAQTRLIKQLDDQLSRLDDPAMRKALLAQRKAAGETLQNLGRRLDELGDISPLDRLKMARGEVPKPQYLDQEPRLFSKIGKAVDQGDAELGAAAQRYTAGRALRAQIDDLLPEPALAKKFSELAEYLQKRARSLLDVAADKSLKGRSFVSQLAGTLKGRSLFDTTLIFHSIMQSVESLGKGKFFAKIDALLDGVATLIEHPRLTLAHIEPLIIVLPLVSNPKRLVELVEKVGALTSFRLKSVPSVAGLLEKAARNAPKLADDLVEEMHKLARLAAERDSIPKAKNFDLWKKAQDSLDAAGKSLAADARFGPFKDELNAAVENFSRSGKFDWKLFKQTLAEENPLDTHGFAPLKDLLEDVKKQIQATPAGKVSKWLDADSGPVLHWSSVLEHVYDQLDDQGKANLLRAVRKDLIEVLPGGLTPSGYKRYRHGIRDAAIKHILSDTSTEGQLSRLRKFMQFLRDDGTDPASIGEYFAAYRRKLFNTDPAPDIQGHLKGARTVELENRALTGLTDNRMVDGALRLPTGKRYPNGPPDGGLFLLEEKAGKSFDLEQAKIYSKLAEDGKLATGSSGAAQGLIYFVEDPKQADTIVSKLNGPPRLSDKIHVVTFSADGTLKFKSRGGEVLAPTLSRSKGKQ